MQANEAVLYNFGTNFECFGGYPRSKMTEQVATMHTFGWRILKSFSLSFRD